MYYNDREEKILEILRKRNSATVKYLAKELFVSEPTVRRALSNLSKDGKIKRTFGGAVLASEVNKEVPLILREMANVDAKKAIAKKAAEKIRNGQVIFMDASSTVYYLLDELSAFEELTVVTNSPKVSLKLAEMKIRCFCTGGFLLEHSISYVGNHAEKFIKDFNADVAFFSTRGLSNDGELTDQSIEETFLRQEMLSHAKEKWFLCTSDKFGEKYSYNFCTLNDVTGMISDKPFVPQNKNQ